MRRRILEYGLQEIIEYSTINDEDLDEIVSTFVADFPCAGQKTLGGYLCSHGCHI